MTDAYGVAAFRSRQQVMRFEAALRRRGIPVQIITTPRAISLGCGLSARFPLEEANRVRQTLREGNPTNLIGLYRAEYDGHRLGLAPLK